MPHGILIVHWNREEAEQRAKKIADLGHTVEILFSKDTEQLLRVRKLPPELFVIDQSRMPSQGREIAAYFRRLKTTRNIPILFVGGDKEHVAKTRKLLPDATIGEWRSIRSSITNAMRSTPTLPAVPGTMAGYSGTPLPKKLGIRENSHVLLVNALERFERKLQPMPAGAEIVERAALANVAILFVQSDLELTRDFCALAHSLPQKVAFWISWPKQASGIKTDLKEGLIREFGLAHGWVDYKICAIDETWSGLCFARPKT